MMVLLHLQEINHGCFPDNHLESSDTFFFQHMYKILIPFLLCCLWGSSAIAQAGNIQDWSFGTINFPDGTSEEYYMFYNSFEDWIYYENDAGELFHFIAEDIVSFQYKGSTYFSLPLNSGNLTFFKVEHEGRHSALLSKPGSLDLMNFLVKRFDKKYTLSPHKTVEDSLLFCEIRFKLEYTRITPNLPIGWREDPLYKEVKPVTLNTCIFAVGEQGLKLIQIDIDRKILSGIWTANRKREVKHLEDFFGRENYRKVQEYAKRNKLKEDHLEDLVILFRYYDDLN